MKTVTEVIFTTDQRINHFFLCLRFLISLRTKDVQFLSVSHLMNHVTFCTKQLSGQVKSTVIIFHNTLKDTSVLMLGLSTLSTLSGVITHPLIFERFYWLLYVTWYKFSGQLSRNNPRPSRYLSSDCFLSRRNIVTRSAQEFQLFFSYLAWKETKLALLSLAMVTLKN